MHAWSNLMFVHKNEPVQPDFRVTVVWMESGVRDIRTGFEFIEISYKYLLAIFFV